MTTQLKHSTRFGPQPIKMLCWQRGLTYSAFIEQTGIRPLSHVRHAMNGVCPPSEELRQRASFILRAPIEELFTAEALATYPQPGRIKGPKPKAGAR